LLIDGSRRVVGEEQKESRGRIRIPCSGSFLLAATPEGVLLVVLFVGAAILVVRLRRVFWWIWNSLVGVIHLAAGKKASFLFL
jgi:hypothetical protein